MTQTTRLYEILYTSTIAPEAPISIVGDIAGQARPANLKRDITGLLIFDGMRFCQYLEGGQKEVMGLLERIREDPRHIGMDVLHQGPLDERRFKQFSLGYTSVEDEDVLARMEQLDGEAALQQFLTLLTQVDY